MDGPPGFPNSAVLIIKIEVFSNSGSVTAVSE